MVASVGEMLDKPPSKSPPLPYVYHGFYRVGPRWYLLIV